MRANIIQDALGNILIQMEGNITFDSTIPFRKEIQQIAEYHPFAEVAIDMAAMDFVGASGIGHFVETLKILSKLKSKAITLKNINQDFAKVFTLYGLTQEHVILDSIGLDDDMTENLNKQFGNRKFTFEN